MLLWCSKAPPKMSLNTAKKTHTKDVFMVAMYMFESEYTKRSKIYIIFD